MNSKTEIWNVLHDGTLSRIDGSVPGNLRLRIEIPYLRHFFLPAGESFIVSLENCTWLSMQRAGEIIDNVSKIAGFQCEILSTDSEDCPAKIATTEGELELDYSSLNLFLDTGQAVAHEDLCKACESYWENWSKKRN